MDPDPLRRGKNQLLYCCLYQAFHGDRIVRNQVNEADQSTGKQGQRMFEGFVTCDVEGPAGRLRTLWGGRGAPLLLLHGHPQTHVMWHAVADALARAFTVVLMDLRGYGDSARVPGDAQHRAYSKRAMALDAVAVMQHHGFAQFQVLAHDRGARLAHRLAADHPDEYERCARIPGTALSICEDYRASATIDLIHDRADVAAQRLLAQPLRVLWAEHGAVGQCFDVLRLWRARASDVSGASLPCGHYIAEEAPALLLAQVLNFFKT
jgi:pimeloyl-ACP methyl ester carboxylesterase